MKKKRSPGDSSSLAERLFREKEKWHKRQTRMSFAKKLEALDRLRERSQVLARVRQDQPIRKEGSK